MREGKIEMETKKKKIQAVMDKRKESDAWLGKFEVMVSVNTNPTRRQTHDKRRRLPCWVRNAVVLEPRSTDRGGACVSRLTKYTKLFLLS